jgi:hypothetical protein
MIRDREGTVLHVARVELLVTRTISEILNFLGNSE